MKDILRTNSFILVIFAFCVSSSSATQTALTISERDDDATKKSHHIAARIRSLSTNVQFFVSCEGGCAGADYNKARSCIPFYSAFGLKAVSPLLRSQEIRQRQDDLIFLYESQETFDGRWGWRPLPMQSAKGGSHYVGQRHGLVTIGFIVKVTTPIKERFTAVEAVVNGERRCTTYESAFADFNIDKAKFDEVFAKQVFMRCHCGLFGVEHSTAKRIMDHDAGGNKLELSQAKVQSRGLIFLDGREISEMVYWLWQRKGKVDEYDSFVKAHPELFEPIAGEEDFRTELGRRLIGTWK